MIGLYLEIKVLNGLQRRRWMTSEELTIAQLTGKANTTVSLSTA